MALRGYIIEKYNTMSGAYTCNRLVEEAGNLGMDLRILGVHDTYLCSQGLCNAGEILEQRDFVINRVKWGRLKQGLNALGMRSYNALDAFQLYINKFEQVRRLRSAAFVMPRYILGTAKIPYERLEEGLGFPVVAKGLEGSMGDQVFLLQSREDMEGLAYAFGLEKEWLFQECIHTSLGRDLRFFSIRGEVSACMQRHSRGDFRANVALGAEVEAYEISPGMRAIARDIYSQTGLDFLGIDLLFGEDKPYFCEINVMPGIEGIEQASGENIARKIMETIRGDFLP